MEQPEAGEGTERAPRADLGNSPPARRISVIGATGSGKTVLARRVSEEWNLPLYELDALFWDRGGRARPIQDFIKAVSDLTKRDAWVLDGHYRAVRELIWHRSEMVIWLNYPLWLVGFRLVRRFLQKRRAAADRSANNGAGENLPTRGSERTATWRIRFERLARTLAERREYGRLLKAPEYRGLELVELRSLRATRDLLRSRAPL